LTEHRAVYDTVDRMAVGEISILLLGETGVGKDVLATRIHERSGRPGPLLRLNCAAVPEALLESELFGHERGAFTGAVQSKAGLFEVAARGTVLLDEIGELSVGVQSKLLRALENREIIPVGSVKARSIDVRFIAATSRDLHDLVASGRFRPDLYYRISGAVARIPPLRERLVELPHLAGLFLAATAGRMNRPPPVLSAEARRRLEAHHWPGNLRELRNVMERAILLGATSMVLPEHVVLDVPTGAYQAIQMPPPSTAALTDIPPAPAAPASIPSASVPSASGQSLSQAMSDLERRTILEALEACGGNQTRAAKLLGMRRGTLLARLDAYGVKRPRRT
jgi:transcriptional regulator with GAF, ATPase, and Fis domain